jgi:hypothetical protein
MEDATARKARLLAMRQEAEAGSEGEDMVEHAEAEPEPQAQAQAHDQETGGNGSSEPALKFRNYALRDEKISHEQVWRFSCAINQTAW